MSVRRPPAPTGAKDWQGWATALVRWLIDKDVQADAPSTVRPATRKTGDRPSANGLVMYDPVLKSLVVSRDGQWRQIKDVDQ